MASKTSKPFYQSKEWQGCREAVLMRDHYLCVQCGAPASDVHHIVHINESNVYDPSVTLNPDNLVSLCKACHNRVHHGAAYGVVFDDNGYVVEAYRPGH